MHPQICELGLRGDRHWLSKPTTCFRIIRREICFYKTSPIMMPKRIGYKISTIFLFARVGDKMAKTGTADRMKCASKSIFRSRVRYTSRRQVLD